ncbi:serine/threonine-protein kinase [Salix suchowensis]|nr:serine/threonine-protein kinase [Salix suchowensis]
MFDPLVGQILSTLFSAACRDNEGTEEVHHLAYECIGILGAVDPDRCDIRPSDSRMIMMRNFVDEDESTAFVLHLIGDLLVLWTVHLISRASGATAQKIFGVFRSAVRNKDVGVARFLLPHLILNILISGQEDDREAILFEILAVLRDQDTSDSASSPDKKLLSAQVCCCLPSHPALIYQQAIFMLLDHLSTWVRVMRQEVNSKKQDTARRARIMSVSDEELLQVDSILSSIDQELMAKAALQCKAYARSLMNFEQLVRTTRERSPASPTLHSSYERLHEIYAYLDEPDGMEGVSTLILNPSLEHQIRQHESLGQWTSAQSCWELCLQKEPDNLDLHLGLLRCLRNLGTTVRAWTFKGYRI